MSGMEDGEMFWSYIVENIRTGICHMGFACLCVDNYLGEPLLTLGLASDDIYRIPAEMRANFFRLNKHLDGCAFDLAQLKACDDRQISLVSHFLISDFPAKSFRTHINKLIDELTTILPQELVTRLFTLHEGKPCDNNQLNAGFPTRDRFHLN